MAAGRANTAILIHTQETKAQAPHALAQKSPSLKVAWLAYWLCQAVISRTYPQSCPSHKCDVELQNQHAQVWDSTDYSQQPLGILHLYSKVRPESMAVHFRD